MRLLHKFTVVLASVLLPSAAFAAPCDGVFPATQTAVYRAVVAQNTGLSLPGQLWVNVHNTSANNITISYLQQQQGFFAFECSGQEMDNDTTVACTNVVVGPGNTVRWVLTLGNSSVDTIAVTAVGGVGDRLPIVQAELVADQFDICGNVWTTVVYDHVTFQRDDCR